MVIYINEKYLKDRTNLTNNIDSTILVPAIIKAQDLFISPFLGYELDLELKTALANETTTAVQNELLAIIRKAQVEYTCYISYYDILIRMTNKTGSIGGVENGVSITIEDVPKLREMAKGFGKYYLQQVAKFIHFNKSSFPTFHYKEILSNVMFDYQNENPYYKENNSGYYQNGYKGGRYL